MFKITAFVKCLNLKIKYNFFITMYKLIYSFIYP